MDCPAEEATWPAWGVDCGWKQIAVPSDTSKLPTANECVPLHSSSAYRAQQKILIGVGSKGVGGFYTVPGILPRCVGQSDPEIGTPTEDGQTWH